MKSLPERMAQAAYERREPGMIWDALSRASQEAMVDDMKVALAVIGEQIQGALEGS